MPGRSICLVLQAHGFAGLEKWGVRITRRLPPAACCFSPNFLILYIFLFFSHLTGWEVAQDFTVEDAKAVCELVHRDESLVVEKRRFFL
jgi:hypothetical protein